MNTCKNCNIEIKSENKFCTPGCAAKYNAQPLSLEHKEKISKSKKSYFEANPDKIIKGEQHSKKVGISTKSGKKLDSILSCSSRTVSKILKRLDISCCVCGWKEGTIDIHHIRGKKIENPNSHDNLTALCPNHHRLFHEKKLSIDKIIPFSLLLPENWQELYYG